MKHVHHLHHLIDDQKFKFVPDLDEIGHFEVAREGEDMNKRETTTIEKEETVRMAPALNLYQGKMC
ncbi:MAG: hypothetical protein QXU98_12295 [Candidatus Parvarchaeota archaeon]